MLIDVHTHPMLPGYVNAMSVETGVPPKPNHLAGAEHEPWSVDIHVETMKTHGIDCGVGSLPALDRAISGEEGHARARALNEELAALAAHPSNRFGAFAVIPTDDMDAALKETEYALDVLKLDGVCTSPHQGYEYLGAPHFDPWLAELDRRGTVLFVHPGRPPGYEPEKNRIYMALLEFMFETTRAVTSMILSGAKERFARVKYVATHGGGTVPYLTQRIANFGPLPFIYKGGPRYSKSDIDRLLATFYFDTAAATSHVAFHAMRQLVPAKQILMGFDYPLIPASGIAPAKAALDTTDVFTREEKEQISSGNAIQMFSRFRRN